MKGSGVCAMYDYKRDSYNKECHHYPGEQIRRKFRSLEQQFENLEKRAIASNWTTLGSPHIMLYLLNGKPQMLYRIDQKMFRLNNLFLICFKFRQ